MDMGFIIGVMESNIKDFGRIMQCMVKAYILGMMEDDMTVNMLWIKSMDSVNIYG